MGKRQKRRDSGSQTVNESGGVEEEEAGDQRGIEGFPVEVIGNILAHVNDLKKPVRASWTCRKWRLVLRHVHTLRLPALYERDPRMEKLEVALTDTILQTTGLQNLQICCKHTFSATAVIAWLLHAGEALRHLTYSVPSSILYVNVLERCGRMKCLQSLVLAQVREEIRFTADPSAQLFPCLVSLSLSFMTVSAIELQSLVSSCQKLESFCLKRITFPDPRLTLHLRIFNLKSFIWNSTTVDSLLLEAEGNLLDSLQLGASNFTAVMVKTGAKLRSLGIDKVSIRSLDLGHNTDCLELEKVEVDSSCDGVWAAIDSLLSKRSSKLRKLQLKGVPPGLGGDRVNLNLETIACLFPRLNHLALSYTVLHNLAVNHQLQGQLQGSTMFEAVQFLQLGGPDFDDALLLLMGGALRRCPNVRKLQMECKEDSTFNCKFMTSLVNLAQEFLHVDIEFG